MSYVESFARAMERARASVSYWDHKTLDHLQAAHDAEMRQCSKSEYHRGFEDGKATRDADQWRLDRERARIIRKLDALRLNADGGSHHNLSIVCKAVYEPSFGWSMGACERLRDRLIYLLGADTILKEDGDGMARGDFERGNVPCDSVGARDVPEEAVVDECNFSGAESDMDTEDGDMRPAETPDEPSDHVSLGTQPVTDEQREYADDYCYRGNFEAFKSTAYHMPWDNPAETPKDANDNVSFGTRSVTNGTMGQSNGTCPITVQSPSITDELREWMDLVLTADDQAWDIADRIDAQFERICSQFEAVLQQTIIETVDEHECEMDELRADYEQAISDITGVERGEGSDLLMPVDVFMHVRDGLRHDVEMWRDRTEDILRERDDLLDKLQAISVLCEQDDG